MLDNHAFLSAILRDPNDDGPRLVYADWLEDYGDGLVAERIRVYTALRPALYSDWKRGAEAADPNAVIPKPRSCAPLKAALNHRFVAERWPVPWADITRWPDGWSSERAARAISECVVAAEMAALGAPVVLNDYLSAASAAATAATAFADHAASTAAATAYWLAKSAYWLAESAIMDAAWLAPVSVRSATWSACWSTEPAVWPAVWPAPMPAPMTAPMTLAADAAAWSAVAALFRSQHWRRLSKLCAKVAHDRRPK